MWHPYHDAIRGRVLVLSLAILITEGSPRIPGTDQNLKMLPIQFLVVQEFQGLVLSYLIPSQGGASGYPDIRSVRCVET